MTTTEQKDPSGRITQAELARRLKVSRPSVSKAVKSGRIVPDEDGLFDPVEAELQWLANTRPKAQGITTKGKGAGNGYAQARARKETALARMAELRLEQAEGELIPKEAHDFLMDDFWAVVGRMLGEFPARYGPQLTHIRGEGEMIAALDDAIRETQTGMSNLLKMRLDELLEAAQGNR